MPRFLLRLSVALVSLLALTAPLLADDAELRWRFKKGQVLEYLIKHREVRHVAVEDRKAESSNAWEFEWKWTVVDVDDKGTAALEMKLGALRATHSAKDFDFQYDSGEGNRSDDEFKKKLIHFYDQLLLVKFQMKVKSDGRVTEVKGFDKLVREAGVPADVTDFYGLYLRDASAGWIMQQVLGVLPPGAAPEGKKWQVPVDAKITDMGQIKGKMDFAVAKAVKVGERVSQELQVSGKYNLDIDMKWLKNPLRGSLKTTKVEGVYFVDPKGGTVLGCELLIDLAGELKLGDPDKPAVMKMTFEHAFEVQQK